MAGNEAHIPVIVGIGQINDRPSDPAEGLDSLGLMEAALRIADEDAGGGFLARIDSLAVVDQISCPDLTDLPDALSQRLGVRPRFSYKSDYASGDSPIRMLNEAANRIAEGQIEIAAVVGGEALRTAAQRAAKASGGSVADHNATRDAGARRAMGYRQRYGLIAPVDVYPLYENATRAAWGQPLAEAQRESGEIWSRFSEVAMDNPGAWIKKPRSPEEIITPSADNRPIAFPYNKLMVANSAVNQGAGFIVCSLAKAREAGIPEDRLVYVGAGAAAHEGSSIMQRDRYDRTAAMEVSLRRAMQLNDVTAEDLDAVELYSCFPCVPKMARRVLDWPLDKPATVFGGLTFGGGPIGNYMSHAVVGMVLKIRGGARKGLLFANGGIATQNHTIVLSAEPPAAGTLPCDFDFQAHADALRGEIPRHAEDYAGPGRIETYTVLYERDGSPKFGVVVARTPAGDRFLAKVVPEDVKGIAFLTNGEIEPVGASGRGVATPDGDVIWHPD